MRFSVIITGYNCEEYVNECIDSVLNQSYTDFEVIAIDDCSTDNTSDLLHEYEGIKVFTNYANYGALYSRYNAVHEDVTGDVVCFLGMDDKLQPNALEVLNKYYKEGVKMTYGSWMTFERRGYLAKPYAPEVFDNKSFRTAGWKATALNTFRTDLIRQVPKEVLCFPNTDTFFDNCTDLAYSFPCLEMCTSEEVAVVKEFIYVYRESHDNTTLARLGRRHKSRIREILKRI